jgi:hypothetical protein
VYRRKVASGASLKTICMSNIFFTFQVLW